MGIPVTDAITTTAPSDTYATHKSTLGQGGHQEVATVLERNAITAERKNVGMKVYVTETDKTYELNSSLVWVEFGVRQSYVHEQMSASSTWVIPHNLNMFPNVLIIDSVGEQVMGNVSYTSLNTVTVNFSAPISGQAYIS